MYGPLAFLMVAFVVLGGVLALIFMFLPPGTSEGVRSCVLLAMTLNGIALTVAVAGLCIIETLLGRWRVEDRRAAGLPDRPDPNRPEKGMAAGEIGPTDKKTKNYWPDKDDA